MLGPSNGPRAIEFRISDITDGKKLIGGYSSMIEEHLDMLCYKSGA